MICDSRDGERSVVYQLKRIGSPASLGEVADIFKLEQDVSLIGRAKGKVEFYMDSAKNKGLISRIHARIFRSRMHSGEYVFKIIDTSLNGTYVNDIKILNEASLILGDTISFGHLQGAVLQAGKSYSQPDSEFQFKFERLPEAHSPSQSNGFNTNQVERSEPGIADCPLTNLQTPKASNCPELSDSVVFLETPNSSSSLQISNVCTTKRELVTHFNESENESDFNILQEYASAASLAAGMQSDSDEELFSVKYSSLLPGGARTEKKRRKRKPNLKYCQESCSHKTMRRDRPHTPDSCSAMKCLNPSEKVISWVQCDDCDRWFHVKCAGLSLKLVKPKNAKFHCGCS